MIYNDYVRKVKNSILSCGIMESEINISYIMNVRYLIISNGYVPLHRYVNFSLTNYKMLLSFLKNDDDFKKSRAIEKINKIEICI